MILHVLVHLEVWAISFFLNVSWQGHRRAPTAVHQYQSDPFVLSLSIEVESSPNAYDPETGPVPL